MDLPEVVEVTSFKFVQLKRILVSSDVALSDVDCVAASSKYGLLFVGHAKGFKVIQLKTVLELDDNAAGQGRLIKEATTNYNHVDVPLLVAPTSVAINCDEATVSVCLIKDNVPFALMYDIRAFASSDPPYPFNEVRLSATPGTKVQDFCWNPAVVTEFAVCLTDGSASVYGLEKDSLKICGTLSSDEGIITLCWSPKGKQIVAGKRNGHLCQYKPNLQPSKIIPPPSGIGEGAYVASVCWLTTTLFAAVFAQYNGNDKVAKLILISVPKGQNPSYTDFGDVCFGNGQREVKYWMRHIPEWKILVCTSSNSVETAVIGYNDQGVWVQWNLDDNSRAELPLFQGQETLPLGASVMMCSQRRIAISSTESHPPMPILFLLSTAGILCPFHMLNLSPGLPSLVTQPETLQSEGQRKGKVSLPLGKPYETSTPIHTGVANTEPSRNFFQEQAPPAKTNLLKNRFPEEMPNTQAVSGSSFQKLTELSSNDSASKNSKFAFSPVSTNTPSSSAPQPLSFQTRPEAQFSSIRPAEPLQDAGHSRKLSRPILTPIAPSKTTTVTKTPATPQEIEKTNVESAFSAALLEEIKEFSKEIQESKSLISQTPLTVGSKEEMNQIRNETHEMQVFCEDIKKTVQSVNLDIHMLKGCVFDTFAVLEEARSLEVRNKDPVYLSLLRKRALDPVSARKLKEIRKLCQYFDSQVTEIHRRLNQDWEDYLDKRKRNKYLNRSLSGVEAVYRTLYNNLNIIKSLEEQIDKIIAVTKKKKLTLLSGASISQDTTFLSNETTKSFSDDLSSLADSLLKSKISQDDVKMPTPFKNIMEPLNPQKENALREFLCNRRVPTVKATSIHNLRDSRLISAIEVMKETSWAQKNTRLSEMSQRENSVETDVSKSDPEIKEALSMKDPNISTMERKLSTGFTSIGGAESNWPPSGMSASGKSSVSSLTSGESVITNAPLFSVPKSSSGSSVGGLQSGGIMQGTPFSTPKPEQALKKPEPKPSSLFQPTPPPNITLPFHSPPVHMVAKTNAALVSAPVMVPIQSKSEVKVASPNTTLALNQAPIFNFGKSTTASSGAFQFSLSGSKSSTKPPETTTGQLPLFGSIKICEPSSFSAIAKPPKATNVLSEPKTPSVISVTASTSGFNLINPTLSNSAVSPSTSVKTTISEQGSQLLLKETPSSGTEIHSSPDEQYEDITPPETPAQSEVDKDDEDLPELTKVIEVSVNKSSSSTNVKVTTLPTTAAASAFSFKLPQSANVSVPTTKSTFSLSHLLKADGSKSVGESSKPISSFQFGSGVNKEGTPTFSFALPSDIPASPTNALFPINTTVAPIAVSSTITGSTSTTAIKTVSASNVTIPTNASATAFSPVTSSSEKEPSTNKEESSNSTLQEAQLASKPSLQPPTLALADENNTNENIPVSETPPEPQSSPPPSYSSTSAAFPVLSTSSPGTTTLTNTPVFASSLFGTATPATTSAPRNLFGQINQDTTSFVSPSTTTQTSSLFGSMTSFSQPASTSFGQTTTSSSQIFGSMPSQASPFGMQNPAPTGIFGQPVQQASSAFGGPASNQSFGQTSMNSGFGAFGQQSPPQTPQASPIFSMAKPHIGYVGSSPFNRADTTPKSTGSLFGQSPQGSSLFDQSTSFFGGLGGQPSAENANKNVFGAPFSNQSPATTGSGLFGSPTSGGFGSKFGNNSFTGGSFSAGGTSVAETGFGAFSQSQEQQQQTPTKIASGASPGFGAPPVFGGSPIFGSNTFGQPTSGAFGSGAFGTSNATPMFDTLAIQAPTFGSLSQQPSGSSGFGGGSSVFGSAPSFGGQSSGIGSQSSAFTQWRQ